MKKLLYLLIVTPIALTAQVGVGTTNPQARLDVTADNNGILIPRVALTSTIVAAPVVNPGGEALPISTLIYNTTTAGEAPNNVVPGFYYWNGTTWQPVGSEFQRIGNIVRNTTNTTGDHFLFGSTSMDDIPGTNDNHRMFFNKGKAAFRAGRVNDNQWDDANVGLYSSAMGFNTTASEYASTAIGAGTTASAWGSVAMGNSTVAAGSISTAMGERTRADGLASTAMGNVTIAVGSASTAMGFSTRALGYAATAMGDHTVASGQGSTAMGVQNNAESLGETVLGQYAAIVAGNSTAWVDTDRLFGIGNGTSNATRSDAFTILKNGLARLPSVTNPLIDAADGKAVVTKEWVQANAGTGGGEFQRTSGVVHNTTNLNADHFVFGSTTLDNIAETTADDSRMFFNKAKAAFRAGYAFGTEWNDANVGQYSTALGYRSRASGEYSTALGGGIASENSATAIGISANASGNTSVALGAGSASKDYATATGYKTSASGEYSTAMGNTTSASGNNSTTMGAGTSASGEYSTAMGLGNSANSLGETVLGHYASNVTGSADTWVTTDQLLAVGNGTGSSNRSNALTLYKDGNLTVAGTVTSSSDARLKTNIVPLSMALTKVLALNGYHYNWNTHYADKNELHTGLLAQEVQKLMPELVRQDANGTLSVNYNGMVPYLIESVKTQQKAIQEQRTMIETLLQKIETLLEAKNL